MSATTAKENILKRIRQALSHSVPLPFPQSEGTNSVFHPATDSLDIVFAQEFINMQGKFSFCLSEAEMQQQLQQLIAEKNSKALIEIDGGVDLNNYQKLIGCGADVLVAGNTVFSASNPSEMISKLKKG